MVENKLTLENENLIILYYTNYNVDECRQIVKNGITTIIGVGKLFNNLKYTDLNGKIIIPSLNNKEYMSMCVNDIYTRIVSNSY